MTVSQKKTEEYAENGRIAVDLRIEAQGLYYFNLLKTEWFCLKGVVLKRRSFNSSNSSNL